MLHGSDAALRFVGADIIREMASTRYDTTLFWPPRSDWELVAEFPPGQQAGSDWIGSFYSFIDQVDRETCLSTGEE